MAKEGRMTNYMNTPLCMSGSPFSERYVSQVLQGGPTGFYTGNGSIIDDV